MYHYDLFTHWITNNICWSISDTLTGIEAKKKKKENAIHLVEMMRTPPPFVISSEKLKELERSNEKMRGKKKQNSSEANKLSDRKRVGRGFMFSPFTSTSHPPYNFT